MGNKISTKLSRAILSVLLFASFCAQAQQDKFHLGGNERTETGPMLIWSGVAFGVAFILLLIFKLRYDKKKRAELKEQMKATAARHRTSQTRSTSSRTRGSAAS
ncbi:MAG: hypothetical protein K0S33_3333 [Bacteroidetes bacterium]|jgi:hypothetical protein|nr:hypothetical protein [Bacteroidota bacterium]